MASNDYRSELTNKIIESLENGTAPWQKPWDGSKGGFFPYNATTGQQYHGGNAIFLASQGYDDPRWCTFNQASSKGWKIHKGEKATWVEYWKWPDNSKEATEDVDSDVQSKTKPSVFYAKVFNLSQMDHVPELQRIKHEWNPLDLAESTLKKSGAKILHDQSDSAFYIPIRDQIHLPAKAAFKDASFYYATAMHELGHWTGHASRLNRDLNHRFGTEGYAKEELRAELASLFLADRLGIPYEIGQHASYVQSWIKVLKEDKHEIFKAARDGEMITEYVMDIALDRVKEKSQVLASPTNSKEQIQRKMAIAIHQLQKQGVNIPMLHDVNKPSLSSARKR